MTVDDPGHIPVLLNETLAALALQPGETAVDGTAGRGGHTAAFSRAVGETGRVIAFDLDADNLAFAEARARNEGGIFEGIHGNFAAMADVLTARDLRADAVLLDLGFSSTQMDAPERGFSFRASAPLDMRYDRSCGATAADLLTVLNERELADLIFRYGEDPFARRIARKLAQMRTRETMDTTDKLARAVREAYGPRANQSRVDPATRTFMALRIAVNNELGSLEHWLGSLRQEAEHIGMHGAGRWLNPGARVGVISFHSLEDRLVKRTFSDLKTAGLAALITRKPVEAGEVERLANPRARSAKLRAARIGRRD